MDLTVRPRLGMAVKVALAHAVLDRGVPHPAIRTSNDGANGWMIAINEALGFNQTSRVDCVAKRR